MGDVEVLEARVAELERRIEILFTNTGAIDLEAAGRGAPEASPEVTALVQAGKLKKAIRLHQEETGADLAQTMAALKKLAN